MLESQFVIEWRAPYTLNYLIYLQNAVHNWRANQGSRKQKFPYVSVGEWSLLGSLLDEERFQRHFRAIWLERIGSLAIDAVNDHNGTLEAEKELFRPLFAPGEAGRLGFEQSLLSFHAWFESYLGGFALDKLISDHAFKDVYDQIKPYARDFNERSGKERLTILLLYDELLDDSLQERSPFVFPFYSFLTKQRYDQTAEQIIRQLRAI